MNLKKLDRISQGESVELNADRFGVHGQEISYLENEEFVTCWNQVLEEIEPFAKDSALAKIYWRAHVANTLFVNSFKTGCSYVECGTHLGVISRMIFKLNKDKSFNKYLFDTWCGVPEDQFGRDEPLGKWHNDKNYTEDTYEVICALTKQFDDVHLVRGQIPDTLEEKFNKVTPCFLHVDMNIEYPERKALEFFVPQMPVGSVVLLDDYGFQRHTKQRMMQDTFFAKLGKIPTQIPTGQAFVVI